MFLTALFVLFLPITNKTLLPEVHNFQKMECVSSIKCTLFQGNIRKMQYLHIARWDAAHTVKTLVWTSLRRKSSRSCRRTLFLKTAISSAGLTAPSQNKMLCGGCQKPDRKGLFQSATYSRQSDGNTIVSYDNLFELRRQYLNGHDSQDHVRQ